MRKFYLKLMTLLILLTSCQHSSQSTLADDADFVGPPAPNRDMELAGDDSTPLRDDEGYEIHPLTPSADQDANEPEDDRSLWDKIKDFTTYQFNSVTTDDPEFMDEDDLINEMEELANEFRESNGMKLGKLDEFARYAKEQLQRTCPDCVAVGVRGVTDDPPTKTTETTSVNDKWEIHGDVESETGVDLKIIHETLTGSGGGTIETEYGTETTRSTVRDKPRIGVKIIHRGGSSETRRFPSEYNLLDFTSVGGGGTIEPVIDRSSGNCRRFSAQSCSEFGPKIEPEVTDGEPEESEELFIHYRWFFPETKKFSFPVSEQMHRADRFVFGLYLDRSDDIWRNLHALRAELNSLTNYEAGLTTSWNAARKSLNDMIQKDQLTIASVNSTLQEVGPAQESACTYNSNIDIIKSDALSLFQEIEGLTVKLDRESKVLLAMDFPPERVKNIKRTYYTDRRFPKKEITDVTSVSTAICRELRSLEAALPKLLRQKQLQGALTGITEVINQSLKTIEEDSRRKEQAWAEATVVSKANQYAQAIERARIHNRVSLGESLIVAAKDYLAAIDSIYAEAGYSNAEATKERASDLVTPYMARFERRISQFPVERLVLRRLGSINRLLSAKQTQVLTWSNQDQEAFWSLWQSELDAHAIHLPDECVGTDGLQKPNCWTLAPSFDNADDARTVDRILNVYEQLAHQLDVATIAGNGE